LRHYLYESRVQISHIIRALNIWCHRRSWTCNNRDG
jgi:hypothetical protein